MRHATLHLPEVSGKTWHMIVSNQHLEELLIITIITIIIILILIIIIIIIIIIITIITINRGSLTYGKDDSR